MNTPVRSERIDLRVTKREKRAYKALAKKRKKSLSDLARELLDEEIKCKR